MPIYIKLFKFSYSFENIYIQPNNLNMKPLLNTLSSKLYLAAMVCGCVLLAPNLAAAANAYGDVVTCSGSSFSSCYDFTVFSNAGTAATGQNAPPTVNSKAYLEVFLKYNTSDVIASGANKGYTPNVSLDKVYFSPTGLLSPGATSSNWASLITNAYLDIPAIVSGAPLIRVSNPKTGVNIGDLKNVYIDFSVGNTFYQIKITDDTVNYFRYSTGSKPVNSAGYTENVIPKVAGLSNLSYGNTNGSNTLGSTPAFGGQIAPEMSPQASFNVLALLVCLFMLYGRREYKTNLKLDFPTSSSLT